ncbi:MAG: hypothetical protein M1491_04340, partial [Deltaproteobacteria bacterium]|nr:hypothetical protein [Deltaproteobacteria bacterium]
MEDGHIQSPSAPPDRRGYTKKKQALIPKVIMGLIEQKERVFDTAKGNTSGLPAMLPWYSAWTASL